MTDSNDRPTSAFPRWLQSTRQNWIATGTVLLVAGVISFSPADDLTGVILSLTCCGLALVCFTAAALDGPHIQTHTCTCQGLCLCRLGALWSRSLSTLKQWASHSSTEQPHSTNSP